MIQTTGFVSSFFIYFLALSINAIPTLASTLDIDGNSMEQSLSIACQAHVVVALDASGNASLDPEDLVVFIDSDCAITDTTLSQSTFDCNDVGVVTVFVTVYNDCGEYNVCTTDIEVADNSGPTAVCHAFHTIALNSEGEAFLDPETLDAGSMDNCDLTFSLDQTVFTCEDIGTFDVLLYVDDGSTPTNACLTTLTVQDLLPPEVACYDMTITLDEEGNASVADYLDDLFSIEAENCGSVTYEWSPTTFNCSHVGNTWQIAFDFEDSSGNMTTCNASAYVTGPVADEDCDTVSDPCDVCPFGDDRIDFNSDGIPDCSQLLTLADYDPVWICGDDRVLACKINPSGAQTKCIKENKIAWFLSQGNHIGPCLSCPTEAPSIVQSTIAISDLAEQNEQLEIYPNPLISGSPAQIIYKTTHQFPGTIHIFHVSGKLIYENTIEVGTATNTISVPLGNAPPGVYFIKITDATSSVSKVFLVK